MGENNTILYLSTVKVFEDMSADGVKSYGIEYLFGDGYSASDIEKLNTLCDTITFREHYRFITGIYPVGTEVVTYGIGGKYHNVIFYNVPLYYVKLAANKIARILNTTCICPYNDISVYDNAFHANYIL